MKRLCIALRLHYRVMDKMTRQYLWLRQRQFTSLHFPLPLPLPSPGAVNAAAFERAWKIAGRLA